MIDANWDHAIFQDLGSSPASMEAGKMADAYGSLSGHEVEQADVCQDARVTRRWEPLDLHTNR